MPNWTGRVFRIVAVGAVVTVLMFAVTDTYTEATREEPLRRALSELPYVEAVELEATGRGGSRHVVVFLTTTPQLREAYLDIESLLDDRTSLTVRDRRTPELVRAFYSLRPYVLEAAARGNHTAMSEQFHAAARRLGLSEPTNFTADARHLYMQLHKDGNYLYAVEPLPGHARPERNGAQDRARARGEWESTGS